MSPGYMIRLARPSHWIKNGVVLLPVVFGMRMTDVDSWWRGIVAAAAFCLVSSFGYIINDIRDIGSDRHHPAKKDRLLASGKVSVKAAFIEAFILLAAGAALAFCASRGLFIIVMAYVILGLSYSIILKHKALVDVICIAMGFVLRTAAGAVAIHVEVSPWLFICMFTICLFMGFCKRYSEVVTIGDMAAAKNHRPTLIVYTPELLTHLITVSAGIAIVAFLLYGLNPRTVAQFGTNYFVYTLPVVVYGVFRFAMLSMEGAYSDPTDLVLHDRPFQMTVLLWVALALCIINWGGDLSGWLKSTY